MADASLMFVDGNLFALRGVADPLKGGIAFLDQVGIQGTAMASIDGFVNFDTGQFRIEVNPNAGARIGGFAPGGKFRLILNNDMIRAELMVELPLVGRAEVTGFINWRFGTFELRGSGNLSLGIFGSVKMSFRFGNSAAQPAKIDVTAAAALRATWNGYGVGLSFKSDVSVNFATGAFAINGTATGTVYLGFLGSVSISVTVGTGGFSIDLPWPIPDVSISFPSFLHSNQPGTLTQGEAVDADALPAIVDEAMRRLSATGLTLEQALLLRDVEFRTTKIDNKKGQLAYVAGDVIHIDDDAAGHGWFVDPTPQDDAEFDPAAFPADRLSAANGRMDLLSVAMHELTHVLEAHYPGTDFGFGESVTAETIGTGERFVPAGSATFAFRDDDERDNLWGDQTVLSALDSA